MIFINQNEDWFKLSNPYYQPSPTIDWLFFTLSPFNVWKTCIWLTWVSIVSFSATSHHDAQRQCSDDWNPTTLWAPFQFNISLQLIDGRSWAELIKQCLYQQVLTALFECSLIFSTLTSSWWWVNGPWGDPSYCSVTTNDLIRTNDLWPQVRSWWITVMEI